MEFLGAVFEVADEVDFTGEAFEGFGELMHGPSPVVCHTDKRCSVAARGLPSRAQTSKPGSTVRRPFGIVSTTPVMSIAVSQTSAAVTRGSNAASFPDTAAETPSLFRAAGYAAGNDG